MDKVLGMRAGMSLEQKILGREDDFVLEQKFSVENMISGKNEP